MSARNALSWTRVGRGGIFTAEDLGEEHLAIARTVDEFWAKLKKQRGK